MKFLFLCGSLEPGKDGVGDYCRRLAAELIRNGQEAWVIALNDDFVNTQTEQEQVDEAVQVRVLRLSVQTPLSERTAAAHRWIQQQQPDWISLHYVLYSYHNKGLPLNWVRQFKRLASTARWHIMLHELWVGSIQQDTRREKLTGLLQRYIIKSTINTIRPASITTNLPYFQSLLGAMNISASVLPVFSNMPQGNNSNTQLYAQLPAAVRENRSDWYIAALFGSIQVAAGIEGNIIELGKKVRADNKKLLIIHLGRSHTVLPFFDQVKAQIECECMALGEQPAEDIASFFHQIDFGLSTYNSDFLAKSGSIAAMLYNGLPVVLLKDTITQYQNQYPYARLVRDIPTLRTFCSQDKSWSSLYGLQNTADFYLTLPAPAHV